MYIIPDKQSQLWYHVRAVRCRVRIERNTVQAVVDLVLGDVLIVDLHTVEWTALCGDRADDVDLVKSNLEPTEERMSSERFWKRKYI